MEGPSPKKIWTLRGSFRGGWVFNLSLTTRPNGKYRIFYCTLLRRSHINNSSVSQRIMHMFIAIFFSDFLIPNSFRTYVQFRQFAVGGKSRFSFKKNTVYKMFLIHPRGEGIWGVKKNGHTGHQIFSYFAMTPRLNILKNPNFECSDH